MKKILVVNGPNLNKLGEREPDVYGNQTEQDLIVSLEAFANEYDSRVDYFQSNHEGDLIDTLQESDEYHGIIINPGAFTHYSYAVADCLASIKIPIIEVHISNIYTREEFRTKSVTAPFTVGQITGLGLDGYLLALSYLVKNI